MSQFPNVIDSLERSMIAHADDKSTKSDTCSSRFWHKSSTRLTNDISSHNPGWIAIERSPDNSFYLGSSKASSPPPSQTFAKKERL